MNNITPLRLVADRTEETKVYSKCDLEKPLSFFSLKGDNKDGYDNRCKVCVNKNSQQHYKDNIDKYTLRNKKYAKVHSEKARERHLFCRYGITIEDYNYLFNKQEGKCLGCFKHQSELPEKFHVDHCHNTNKIRGLLCRHCNLSLGWAKDNSQTLRNLADYLDG